MKPFEFCRVNTVSQATALLSKYQEKAAILAGGSDLLAMMKDRLQGPKLKPPQFLVDIKAIKELVVISQQKSGLRIGAAVTIAEIASSDPVIRNHSLLAQAANHVAVPQIRNVGTLGGNLCQRPRCWYFRGRLFNDCLRKGGTICYAIQGESQYHAILGGQICYMVYPSDMAPALIALNAQVEIASSKGNRMVPLERFYIRPEENILRENTLAAHEMLVAVEIPHPAPNSRGIYLKLKERQAFDFAIASVAVSLTTRRDLVLDSRIVFGGIAPFPFRDIKAEAVLKGKRLKEVTSSACRAAVDGAQHLSKNEYKVHVARGILEEALAALT